MNKQAVNIAQVDWSVFSMLIEARRHYFGLSQGDLAAQINVPLDDLIKVEKGEVVSATTYLALCAWYGVQREWFYKDILSEKRQVSSWI